MCMNMGYTQIYGNIDRKHYEAVFSCKVAYFQTNPYLLFLRDFSTFCFIFTKLNKTKNHGKLAPINWINELYTPRFGVILSLKLLVLDHHGNRLKEKKHIFLSCFARFYRTNNDKSMGLWRKCPLNMSRPIELPNPHGLFFQTSENLNLDGSKPTQLVFFLVNNGHFVNQNDITWIRMPSQVRSPSPVRQLRSRLPR